MRGLSVVIQNLAIVHEGRGDLDRAAALLEESVELARAVANPAHIASTLHVLGSLLARRGDAAGAVPLVRESLEISHAAGEGVPTVECLETLAGVAARAGDAVTGATLLGAADAYREATGAVRQPDEQPFVDATVAALEEAPARRRARRGARAGPPHRARRRGRDRAAGQRLARRPLLCSRTTSATDTTMIAAPTSVTGVITSSRTSHPSTIATTGLTYA